MSDNNDPNESDDIKALRVKAGGVDLANSERDQAKRELAFLRADVDETSAVGKMFMRSFDGDITDVEAIKAAALEVGAIKSTEPPPPPETTFTDDEAKQRQAAQQLAAGGGAPAGQPPAKPDPDPVEAAFEVFAGAVDGGMARDKAMVPVVGAILEAAGKQDPRILYDKNRDRGQEKRKIAVPGRTL